MLIFTYASPDSTKTPEYKSLYDYKRRIVGEYVNTRTGCFQATGVHEYECWRKNTRCGCARTTRKTVHAHHSMHNTLEKPMCLLHNISLVKMMKVCFIRRLALKDRFHHSPKLFQNNISCSLDFSQFCLETEKS